MNQAGESRLTVCGTKSKHARRDTARSMAQNTRGLAKCGEAIRRSDEMKKQLWMTYVAPFVLVPLALLVVLGIPALREKTSLLPFLAAVVVTAWFGGMGPSLIAAFLSALLWSLFVVEPSSRLSLTSDDLTRLCLFVLLAVLVSLMYSARQRAQARAEASERRLTVALDAARLAIWEYDIATRKFWTSSGFAQVWRVDGSVVVDSLAKLQGLVHQDDRTRFVETATRAIEQGEPFDVTHRIAGTDVSVRTVGRVHRNPRGQVCKVVGVVVATGAAEA
jgi:K+-sensing histidine kinase KdpD